MAACPRPRRQFWIEPNVLAEPTRLAPYLDPALRRATLETPGETAPEQRVAAAAGRQAGDVTDQYLARVRTASYRIVDDDINRLKRGGLSDDAIFELTLAAASGEAACRFDAAVAALRRAGSDRAL